MDPEKAPPKVSSDISGIRAPGNFQAVDATYYNLTDGDGRSLAALLVLLDSFHRPVRAEIHLYEDLSGQTRDQMMRQAQQILQGRYYSRQPVPLRVLDIRQESHSMEVTLPVTPSANTTARPVHKSRSTRAIWLTVAAVAALLALVWLSARWFSGSGGDSSSSAAIGTVEPTDGPSTNAGTTAQSDVGLQIESDDTLPLSENADPGIAVGVRVRVSPRYQSNLLEQPEANDEYIIGIIGPGETMTVQDGPILRPGETDTIVWWYVLTDSGQQGWVPANTSAVTVLEPIE